jgi:hypothetical protein
MESYSKSHFDEDIDVPITQNPILKNASCSVWALVLDAYWIQRMTLHTYKLLKPYIKEPHFLKSLSLFSWSGLLSVQVPWERNSCL